MMIIVGKTPQIGTLLYSLQARELGLVSLGELLEPDRGQVISFAKAKARRERRQKRADER